RLTIPFPCLKQADASDGITDLYMTTVLYPESDVLRGPEGSGISFFEEPAFRIFGSGRSVWRYGPSTFSTLECGKGQGWSSTECVQVRCGALLWPPRREFRWRGRGRRRRARR